MVQTTDDGRVMTVQEVARYLRMKPVTVYRHAAQGKLPGFKVGTAWRFNRQSIKRWIAIQEKKAFATQVAYSHSKEMSS